MLLQFQQGWEWGHRNEVYIDMMPTVTKADMLKELRALNPRTLPFPLKGMHEIVITNLDTRRLRMLGFDNKTLTGVSFRCRRVPGVGPLSTACKCELEKEAGPVPVVAAAAAAAADDSDGDHEEHEVADATALPMGVQLYMGWRTSFRTTEPEVHDPPAVVARLRRKHAHYLGVELPASSRTMRVHDDALLVS